MKELKILTRYHKGKSGRNISKEKYNILKNLIIKSLKTNNLTFTEIMNTIKKDLKGKFKGSFPWYLETVKLDLEARKIIERIPKTKPQSYKLNS